MEIFLEIFITALGIGLGIFFAYKYINGHHKIDYKKKKEEYRKTITSTKSPYDHPEDIDFDSML